MTAKWLDRRAVFGAMALAATLAAGGEAQLVNGQWRAAPPPVARVGVQVNAPTVFAQQVMNPIVAPRQPVQFTYVPTIVMSDGTVYANYGYGYQQVVTCAPAVVTPYAVYNNGAVYSATPVPQAVPNQQTRSQQMVAQNVSPGGQVVQSPCGARVTQVPAPAVGRRY